MPAHLFPRTLARIKPGWLKNSIIEFLGGLASNGFKVQTMRDYANRLRCFAEFAEQKGIQDRTQLAGQVESFVGPIGPPKKQRQWKSFVTQFAHFASPNRSQRLRVL